MTCIHFSSFTERRRARLRKQVDRLDRLEKRSNAEPVTVTALSLGTIPALVELGLMDAAAGGCSAGAHRSRGWRARR